VIITVGQEELAQSNKDQLINSLLIFFLIMSFILTYLCGAG